MAAVFQEKLSIRLILKESDSNLVKSLFTGVKIVVAYSPLAVANEFVRRAGSSGASHMKLQKLVYYAHGMSLANNDQLLNEQPEVWKLGPVYSSLYFELKYHGGEPISTPEKETSFGPAPMLPVNDFGRLRLLDDVWQKFANFTAVQLSIRTHKAGTPWYTTANQHQWRVPRGTEIAGHTMAKYFQRYGLNG